MSDDMPNGIPEILEYLAQTAQGYNNHLKWNEVSKLKADLMNARQRWLGVPVGDIADRCHTLGMRDEDAAQIADLVRKAQAGRRLIPAKGYTNFRFNQTIAEPGAVTSRQW